MKVIERKTRDGARYQVTSDRPTGPEPTPEPEPKAPDPPPDPAPLAPAPYRYRRDLAPAVAGDAEALARLAALRGRPALDEALALVAALDAEARAQRARLAARSEIPSAVDGLADLIGRRAIYATRARVIAGALGVAIDPIPDVAPVPELARIAAALPAHGDLLGDLATRAARLRSELDQADAQMEQLEDLARADDHYHAMGRTLFHRADALASPLLGASGPRAWHETAHPSDAWLTRASELTARRRALAEQLGHADADLATCRALVASRMAAAVERAGGPGDVVQALLTARALASPATPTPPELAAVDADLARLEAEGLGGGGKALALKDRRRDLLGAVASDRQARRERRRAEASDLVDAALAGDEGARGAIETILARAPTLAPTLLADVAAARPDRALLAALAAD